MSTIDNFNLIFFSSSPVWNDKDKEHSNPIWIQSVNGKKIMIAEPNAL